MGYAILWQPLARIVAMPQRLESAASTQKSATIPRIVFSEIYQEAPYGC